MHSLRTFGVSICLLALAPLASAQTADGVLSRHIREADATSGQDTNSGSGVKTGHIQDAAVTTAKIATGAVISATIADGAVTDAKITGEISASKISRSGLDADKVDGKHASDLAPSVHSHGESEVIGLTAALASKASKYGKTAVVARSGGDYPDPVAAMNALAAWCGTPSAENPCAVKIMPGIYALETTLVMQPFVDIEGSGRTVTRIRADGSVPTGVWGGSNPYVPMGVVTGAGNSELSRLTIESVGSSGDVVNLGMYNYLADGQRVTDVAVVAWGDSPYTYGVYNHNTSVVMTDVSIAATSTGLGFVTALLNTTNVPVVLRNLTLIGGMTNMDEFGGPVPVKCQGVYNAQFDPMSCP